MAAAAGEAQDHPPEALRRPFAFVAAVVVVLVAWMGALGYLLYWLVG